VESPEPSPAPEAATALRVRDAVFAIAVGLAASAASALAVRAGGISTLELFAFVVPAQALGTLVTALLIAARRGPVRSVLALRVQWSDLTGIPVGAGIQLVLSALALAVVETFFGGEVPGQEIVESAGVTGGPAGRILVVLGVVVLGPIAEEVAFRGMLLPALLPRGRRWAVNVSSAGFALLHLLDPNALFSVPFLFVVAIVLGNERLRTGRLGRPVAIHAGFNLLTVLAIFATG
jgi:membrane protease YdiL (CAAX protease family)